MNRSKNTVAIIVFILIIINTWTTLSLKKEVSNLQDEISRMYSDFDYELKNIRQYTYDLRNDLVDRIEKGESLLTSFETETNYEDGQLEVAIKVVPKEKNIDEIIFLSVDDEKKEAISTNGSDYVSSFVLTTPQKTTPKVLFESPTSIRQEVLPELDIDELLSLGYESNWEIQYESSNKEEEILSLIVYTNDTKSSSLLSGTPKAEVVIKTTNTDTEIGRKKMNLTENKEPLKEELKAISFNADLGEYMSEEGSYDVWLEMEIEGGIFYSEPIASFEHNGKQSFSRGSGGGSMYPTW